MNEIGLLGWLWIATLFLFPAVLLAHFGRLRSRPNSTPGLEAVPGLFLAVFLLPYNFLQVMKSEAGSFDQLEHLALVLGLSVLLALTVVDVIGLILVAGRKRRDERNRAGQDS